METAVPILAYADAVTRYGVALVRQPGLVRVVVPPLRRIRDIGVAFWAAAAALLLMLVIPAVATIADPEAWPVLVANGTIYGSGLVLLILSAIYRLRRRIIFDVTAQTFALTYV